MRKLMDSGVIVEVDGHDDGYRLALVHRDRTAEWIVSPGRSRSPDGAPDDRDRPMSSTIATALRDAADALHQAADLYDTAQAVVSGRVGGFKASTPGSAPASPGMPAATTGRCEEIIDANVVSGPGGLTVDRKVACNKPRPCPDHDTIVKLTPIEQLALRGHDAVSIAALRVSSDMPKLAALTVRAVDKLQRTVVAHAPARPNKDDACVSCERVLDPKTELGTYTKRAPGSRYCTWCRKKKGDLDGNEPPLDMLGRHLAGEIITAKETAAVRLEMRRGGAAGAQPTLALTADTCPHPTCAATVPIGGFACGRHWVMLGSALRSRLRDTWRAVRNDEPGAIAAHAAAIADAIEHWLTTT